MSGRRKEAEDSAHACGSLNPVMLMWNLRPSEPVTKSVAVRRWLLQIARLDGEGWCPVPFCLLITQDASGGGGTICRSSQHPFPQRDLQRGCK